MMKFILAHSLKVKMSPFQGGNDGFETHRGHYRCLAQLVRADGS